MDYTLTIKDTATAAPIPGASVTFYSPNGSQLAQMITDNNGVFGFDLDEDGGLLIAGNKFGIAKQGYNTLPPTNISELQPDSTIFLDKVNGTAMADSNILPFVLLGGIVLVAYLISKKGK